jgi:hypothetical protein
VPGLLVDLIELVVGLAFVVGAVAAWRTRGLRAVAVALAGAGALAIGHALLPMTGR